MRSKILISLMLIASLPGIFNSLSAQETKKKTLDAFITATTKAATVSEPVPGAEITVEQVPGPTIIKKCTTDEKGEFTLSPEELELAAEKIERTKAEAELVLKISIKPPANFPYKLDDKSRNEVTIKIKKPEKKQVFVLLWQKTDAKSNKGYFAVSSKAQT